MRALALKLAMVALCAGSAAFASSSYVIVAPQAVVSNSGGDYSTVCCDVVDTINENGLNYSTVSDPTSPFGYDAVAAPAGNAFYYGQSWNGYFAQNGGLGGVHVWQSDYPSFTGTPDQDFEWFSQSGQTSVTIVYNLGSSLGLAGFALWNEDSTGVASVAIYACGADSTCASTTQLLAPTSVTANPLEVNYYAQTFQFGSLSAPTQYVSVVVTPNSGTGGQVGIGQVAFEATPEPSTWLLMALGLAATVWVRQRRLAK